MSSDPADARDWLARLPKVELHVHLEGAIPHEALWELVRKYGGDPAVPDLASLEKKFVFRNFSHFVETWSWKNRFLREDEDFVLIAEAVARDLAGQNIRYAEVFFSPSDFAAFGLEPQRIAEAVRRGLARVPEIRISLVADLVRDDGPVKAARTLAEVYEARVLGIIGIGIGGSESKFPPEPFGAVYEEARRLGFRTSAHAGEAAGPESVWAAARLLRVDRIGHATRAAEDESLVEYLAERQIQLEMCPLSNVRTGVIDSLERHPIRRFYDRGIPVTANTDDPKMFGTSLAEEYSCLMDRLRFTRNDIQTLVANAVRASWLPEPEKRALFESIRDDPAGAKMTF